MKKYDQLPRRRIEKILAGIDDLNVGVVGDIGIDMYWLADMKMSELSRETPHYNLPVTKERVSLGAGGNVAANMAALDPGKVSVISAVGNDWRAGLLIKLFEEEGIDTSGLIHDDDCTTNAYIKPLREGISDVVYEDPRLDFTNRRPISKKTEDRIIEELKARSFDILCVCDQMPFSVITERVRQCLLELAKQGAIIVADSRDNIGKYTDMIIKPNEVEATKAAGVTDHEQAARMLAKSQHCDVFMTLGPQGSIFVRRDDMWHIPARQVPGPIDFCGAGDSSLSGFALALAAGAEPQEAAYIAGLCSEVTIRQIGITGTASRSQILNWRDESIAAPINS